MSCFNSFVVIANKKTINNNPFIEFTDSKFIRSQLQFIPDNVLLKIEISEYNEKKEKEKLRTIEQNKYYHKLLNLICDLTGDTHMELHNKLKVKFLAKPYIMDDQEYMIVPSTTELTTKNFSEFLERIFAWASEELNLILPNPS